MSGRTKPRAKPIARAAGIIEAPYAAVAELLLTVHAGPMDDGNLFLLGHHSLTGGGTVEAAGDGSGGVERFRLAYPGGTLAIEVDRAQGTIAVQGGWWYRGEYTVTPTEDGTGGLVALSVYNVAGAGSRWAVPLANGFFRGFAAKTGHGLETTLASAAKHLGAGYRMLDV